MAEAPSVRPPSQARSQETLERFVAATRELLQERPFEDITVADIVARAGRTVGSFYARFDDKDGVLLALLGDLDDRLRVLVRAFCDPVRWDGAPVAEFVAESVKLNVHAYRRSAPLFRAGLVAAVTRPEFREQRRSTLRFCAETQKGFLRTRRRELGCADVDRASDAVFELVAATLDHELLFGRVTATAPEDDGGLVRELVARSLVVLGAAADADAPRP